MIDSFSGEHEFLSNFWTGHQVVVAGLKFISSEHAFQAMKSEEFTDKLQVQACKTPGQAKRMGRKIKLRPDWEEIKLKVMLDVVRAKFGQNPELMSLLLATGDRQLVEGNNHGDRFWGTVDGVGENHLGKILMRVRDEALRHEAFVHVRTLDGLIDGQSDDLAGILAPIRDYLLGQACKVLILADAFMGLAGKAK